MNERYTTSLSPGGTRMQAGIPKGSPSHSAMRAHGLTVKGVVTQVYYLDSDHAVNHVDPNQPPNAIYCDVLCYGKYEGILPRVLVTFGERSGLQDGEVMVPHATTMKISGTLDIDQTNPMMMDGDHVIVGFLEDHLSRPFLLRYLPHPSSDVGNDGKTAGHRMRLKEADGQPRFQKHKGIIHGVSNAGDYEIDLTLAHTGTYQADGSEPTPLGDGSVGNVNLKLPDKAKVTILINGQPAFVLDKSGALATSTLGDGAMHAAIVEHLQTFYTTIKAQLDLFDTAFAAHTHAVTVLGSPSGPPVPATPIAAPAWDASIASSKVSFPDG